MFDDSAIVLGKKRSYLSSSTFSSDESKESSDAYECSEATSSTSDFEDKDSKDSTIGSEDSNYSVDSAEIEIKSNGTDKLEEKKIKHKTVPELKQILKDRGLRVSGSKAELIQRITGVESPSGNQFTPKPKKKKVDLDDPFLKECFICDETSDVPFENKLKDARICDVCKNDPKKRKFTMEESKRIFNLPKPVLRSLPCRRGHNRRNFYYLFAINTLARACVAKYGSLKESREDY